VNSSSNPPKTYSNNPAGQRRALLVVIAIILSTTLSLIAGVLWVWSALSGANKPPITWEQITFPSAIPGTTEQSQQQETCPDWQLAGKWKGVHASESSTDYKATLKQIGAADNNHIWAIGSVWRKLGGILYMVNDSPQTWTEHPNLLVQWDGTNWSQVRIPSVEALAHDSVVFKVLHPISGTDVWLAGTHRVKDGFSDDEGYHWRGRTLLAHYDGNNWSLLDTSYRVQIPDIFAMDSTSSSDVWAVGNYFEAKFNIDDLTPPMTMHWDGRIWSTIEVPAKVTGHLSNVAAISPTDAWAVGDILAVPPSGGKPQSVALHWDGTSWNSVAPNTIPEVATSRWTKQRPAQLEGLPYSDFDILPSGDLWTVGGYDGGYSSKEGYILTAHYTATNRSCP
jgi:hypothetical protein